MSDKLFYLPVMTEWLTHPETSIDLGKFTTLFLGGSLRVRAAAKYIMGGVVCRLQLQKWLLATYQRGGCTGVLGLFCLTRVYLRGCCCCCCRRWLPAGHGTLLEPSSSALTALPCSPVALSCRRCTAWEQRIQKWSMQSCGARVWKWTVGILLLNRGHSSSLHLWLCMHIRDRGRARRTRTIWMTSTNYYPVPICHHYITHIRLKIPVSAHYKRRSESRREHSQLIRTAVSRFCG